MPRHWMDVEVRPPRLDEPLLRKHGKAARETLSKLRGELFLNQGVNLVAGRPCRLFDLIILPAILFGIGVLFYALSSGRLVPMGKYGPALPPKKDEFEDAPGASEMFRKYGIQDSNPLDSDPLFADFFADLNSYVCEYSIQLGIIEESGQPNRADLEDLAAAERGVRESVRSAPPEWIAHARAKLELDETTFMCEQTRRMLAGAIADCPEGSGATPKINPDDPVALNNSGNALITQAQQKSGAEADALLAQAGKKYEAALKIKPDYHNALINWGAALFTQAKQKSGAEADALLAQAGKKYEAALKIKPDDATGLTNWGAALYTQAKQKSGAEADALLAQAGEKCEAALKIKPAHQNALYNWGIALMQQGKTKPGRAAERLYSLAEQKLSASESISPGSSAYGMACLASLRGTPTDAKRWLQTCRDLEKLPSRKEMEEDSDLDAIRNEEWFREFLDN